VADTDAKRAAEALELVKDLQDTFRARNELYAYTDRVLYLDEPTANLDARSAEVVRRILRFLADRAKADEDKYQKSFWSKFGFYLKAGLLEDQQANNAQHRDQLVKLLRFASNKSADRFVSLQEYVDSLPEGQKNIYYIHAPNRRTALDSPYLESLGDKQVLILTEDIDEFMINYIGAFKEHKLISVSAETDVEKTAPAGESAMASEDKARLEAAAKQALGEKASQIKFTDKLKTSPAVVTSQISPHMRKMMKNMMKESGQAGGALDALDGIPVTFELNENHRLVQKIATLTDPVLTQMAIKQLFDNACIAAGMIEDPRLLLGNLNDLLSFCVFQGEDKQ